MANVDFNAKSDLIGNAASAVMVVGEHVHGKMLLSTMVKTRKLCMAICIHGGIESILLVLPQFYNISHVVLF